MKGPKERLTLIASTPGEAVSPNLLVASPPPKATDVHIQNDTPN